MRHTKHNTATWHGTTEENVYKQRRLTREWGAGGEAQVAAWLVKHRMGGAGRETGRQTGRQAGRRWGKEGKSEDICWTDGRSGQKQSLVFAPIFHKFKDNIQIIFLAHKRFSYFQICSISTWQVRHIKMLIIQHYYCTGLRSAVLSPNTVPEMSQCHTQSAICMVQ